MSHEGSARGPGISVTGPVPGMVSIMMPAYNAAPYIRAAIDSVLAQSYSNWELIVVDDGSSDGTGDFAASIGDPRIHLVRQQNLGEASARNAALRMCRGEFLAFLDADDVFYPEHLQATAAYLSEHAGCGGVYTDGDELDEAGKRLAPISLRRRGPYEGDIFEQVVLASDVIGPPGCAVLRRTVLVEHRLAFDEQIVIGPDWDFLRQVAEVATFGVLPIRSYGYRLHSQSVSVATDPRRKALSLALCREKAIRSPRFATCSLKTRQAVFFDLLVRQLRGLPERQVAILDGLEFHLLPVVDQGRLLRWMAVDGLVSGRPDPESGAWLERAGAVTSADPRTAFLVQLFRFSPKLCAALLRLRSRAFSSPSRWRGSPRPELEPAS